MQEETGIHFCPLCLAHPDEHGEGWEYDANLLAWADAVTALYDKLQELKSSKPEVVANAN